MFKKKERKPHTSHQNKVFIGCPEAEVEMWKKFAESIGYVFIGAQPVPAIVGNSFPRAMLKFERMVVAGAEENIIAQAPNAQTDMGPPEPEH